MGLGNESVNNGHYTYNHVYAHKKQVLITLGI